MYADPRYPQIVTPDQIATETDRVAIVLDLAVKQLSRAELHRTGCSLCGGSGRHFTTKAGAGGEVIDHYGDCPRLAT